LSTIRNNINVYTDRYFKAIEGLGGEKTYIISLLPRNFDGDDNDYNELINTFNKHIIEQAKNYQTINVIDVHDSFTKDGTMNGQFSYDGLHLNNYGYEILSSILRKYIK
jgi:lysophospholipase L1-like esterase